MNILLVRHGESQANLDKTLNARIADHAIELTPDGVEQAKRAGEVLARWFVADTAKVPITEVDFSRQHLSGLTGERQFWTPNHIITGKLPFRLWNSPYKRTRQTADTILDTIKGLTKAEPASGRREHINLAEEQYGLFDGLSDEECAEKYPDEWSYYRKCLDMEGRFWARRPLGESRWDVTRRVHEAFGTFHRDLEKHRIENIVVVAHGTVNRAFVMGWMHYDWEWFEKEPNPKNCSIRLLSRKDDNHPWEDKGYIHGGG